MDAATKAFVRERAKGKCEYCQLAEDDSPLCPLHIEHTIPKSHGGTDESGNLALACIDCNLHKGPNLAGIDPGTELLTRLFNPRSDSWTDHFEWDGIYIVGKTPIGRVTVNVLKMNAEDQLALRSA